MTPHHVRTIRIAASRTAEDTLEVTGHLVDERPVVGPRWYTDDHETRIHDMTVTVRVRHPDLVITGIDGAMATHPYVLCPEALPPLQRLVGLSVRQGFTRAVNERFGRQRGCAHLTALLHAIAPVVRQGAGAAFDDESEPPRPDQDLWFIDTCQAWRQDGPLADRLRSGDADGLRTFHTPRGPA